MGPCHPPGSEPGPLSWKPRVSEESRDLGPGHGGPSVAGELVAFPFPQVIRSPTDIEVGRGSACAQPATPLLIGQLLSAGRAI